MRLDVLLVKKGLVTSREKAKTVIKEGKIKVEGSVILKSSYSCSEDDQIELMGNVDKYVSRGGYKLEKAIELYQVDLNHSICMDIGASTGGFTDCMLQNGADKVYAIDVGKDQLSEKLLNDKKVVNLEKTNIRYLSESHICDDITFISVDVAFISLSYIFPTIKKYLTDNGQFVVLIKPQFEAGKDKIGKKGVVKDKKTHKEVLYKILDEINQNQLGITKITFSPIKGPNGNIEFLGYWDGSHNHVDAIRQQISDIVNDAHNNL